MMSGVKRKHEEQQSSIMFKGFRVAFFNHIGTKLHTKILKEKLQQHGATVQENVDNATKYLVCSSDFDPARLDNLLPPPSTTAQCSRVFNIPEGVELVIPEFFSNSLLYHKLQDPSKYRPQFYTTALHEQQQQQKAAVSKSTSSASTIPLTTSELEHAALDIVTSPMKKPDSVLDGDEQQQQQQESPPFSITTEEQGPCIVQRQGSEWVAVQGVKPRYTGGDTGIPWGAYGVWDEPWDEASARDTKKKLENAWYAKQAGDNSSSAPASASATNQLEKPPSGASATINSVCEHACCRKRPFCIIDRLEQGKKAYTGGKDSNTYFKIRAIDKGILQLKAYQHALDTDTDVEAVGLGDKTASKVKEILQQGYIEAARAAEDRQKNDPKAATLALFEEVWGAGSSIAQKWYDAGCRSISDVLKTQQLTQQQLVGLEYYDDLTHKIPRDEIEQAERLVRECVFDQVEKLGCQHPEQTYVFATGSYRRGAATSNDMDFLICLPDHVSISPSDFLSNLLDCLLNKKAFLIDRLNPLMPHKSSRQGASSSWLGICKPSWTVGGYVRRCDFKVYAAAHRPFAVNYFANSMDFCRATRFWASNKSELAQQYSGNPEATGFKLSDKELIPVKKEGVYNNNNRGSGLGVIQLGPPLPCTCETDIFKALGLDYVPVTMRKF